jgi:cytochrome c553
MEGRVKKINKGVKPVKNIIILSVLLVFLGSAANASNGKKIFKSKCISCHGQGTESIKAPILHGQEKRYLIHSLESFKSYTRTDNISGVMNSIANGLSAEDIQDVTHYLAASDICDIKVKIDTKAPGWIEKFKEGRTLADSKNCMHCHGSFHHAAPRLYGQKKSYMDEALFAFKNDMRPAFFKMIDIAKSLSDEEADKITHYLNGMRLMRECP